jgi:hypothetical protein
MSYADLSGLAHQLKLVLMDEPIGQYDFLTVIKHCAGNDNVSLMLKGDDVEMVRSYRVFYDHERFTCGGPNRLRDLVGQRLGDAVQVSSQPGSWPGIDDCRSYVFHVMADSFLVFDAIALLIASIRPVNDEDIERRKKRKRGKTKKSEPFPTLALSFITRSFLFLNFENQ